MRTATRALLITVILFAACCCLSFLPVLPVLKGAVVPPPMQHYSLGFASVQDLAGIFALARVGVSYQIRWYTLVGIAGLFIASCLITALAAFLMTQLRPGRWLVLLVFMLAGCNPLVGPPPTRTASPTTSPATLTSTPFPAATPTLIPSPTPLPTQRPQLVATATRTATPSRRPTATRSPTGTPPATIGPFLLYSSDGQPAGEVADPRAAPDGVLWVNTHAGWASLYKNKWTLHPETHGSKLVGFDELGRVWLVSEKGEAVSAWDGVRWTKYGPEAGWSPAALPVLPFNERIATDKYRRVWLATRKDVRAFDGQRWTRYRADQIGFAHTQEMIEAGFSESSYWLTDVAVDREGDAWVADCSWMGPGPLGHGARWLADGGWQGKDSRVVATGCIYDIEVDRAGNIWAGVDGDLWRYTPGQSWKKYPHPPVDPAGRLHWGFITDIALDEAATPWVTLHRCGGASCDTGQYALFHVVGDTWIHILEWQGDRADDLAFAWGEAWLCASSGLYRIKGETLQKIAGEVSPRAACYVEADAAGRVWLTLPGQAALWVYPGP